MGALAGAAPPLIGWAGVRGRLDPGALVLFSIVYLWQLPHFLVIGWRHRKDYSMAGCPILPVVDSAGEMTSRQILVQTWGLLVVSLGPAVFGMAGPAYMAAALILGFVFLGFGFAFAISRSECRARTFHSFHCLLARDEREPENNWLVGPI